MSAGRQLYRFVMERDGRGLDVSDWDRGLVADHVKETWEKEARKILSFADDADEVILRAVPTGYVTITVDVDDAVRQEVVGAVTFGIHHAFRRHPKRLQASFEATVVATATSAALDYLFRDEPDHLVEELKS